MIDHKILRDVLRINALRRVGPKGATLLAMGASTARVEKKGSQSIISGLVCFNVKVLAAGRLSAAPNCEIYMK